MWGRSGDGPPFSYVGTVAPARASRYAPAMSTDVMLLEPGRAAAATAISAPELRVDGPRISCIMATRGRIVPARHAIDCFLRQSYRDRELVIACADAGDEVRRHIAGIADPRIRFLAAAAPANAGLLRNVAVAEATGSLVCIWDDDDLSDPDRLARQFAAIVGADARACFLSRTLLWWPERRRIALSSRRIWENTMLAERAALPLYEGSDRGNDTLLAKALRAAVRIVLIDRAEAYCYIAHGANLWSAGHFEMLFANSSDVLDGPGYGPLVDRLGVRLPLVAYAADLAGTSPG